MLTLVGTYINGYLKLDKEYTTEKPVKVIVTFLEEQLMNRFSFYQQANYRVSSAQITESELKKIILKHAS